MNNILLPDILAFGVIAACVFMSMMRGAIAELFALIAWFAAFFTAKLFAEPFANVAFQSMQPRGLAVMASFAVLFFAAWLVLKFVRSLLTAAVSAVGLGSINRLLGGVLGAAKGILLATVAVMLASYTDLPQTESWQQSRSIPYFEALAKTAVPYLSGISETGGNMDVDAEADIDERAEALLQPVSDGM